MEYLTTLVHCATLAISLAICVYLFVSVKRDVHVLEARYLRRGENLRKQLQELAEELEIVRKEIENMDQRSDPGVIARTLGSGIRIQALRMIKHGQGPQHISAALGMTRTEVELLVKVQRLIAEPAIEVRESSLSGLLRPPTS
jgi:hypothetical protein